MDWTAWRRSFEEKSRINIRCDRRRSNDRREGILVIITSEYARRAVHDWRQRDLPASLPSISGRDVDAPLPSTKIGSLHRPGSARRPSRIR
jgi:hypothetical protein